MSIMDRLGMKKVKVSTKSFVDQATENIDEIPDATCELPRCDECRRRATQVNDWLRRQFGKFL